MKIPCGQMPFEILKWRKGCERRSLPEDLDEELSRFLQTERSEARIVENKDLAAEVSKIAGKLNIVNIKLINKYVDKWKQCFM